MHLSLFYVLLPDIIISFSKCSDLRKDEFWRTADCVPSYQNFEARGVEEIVSLYEIFGLCQLCS